MEVGHRIQNHRKVKQWSQEQLAEKMNVSTQTISNWENERSYPSLYYLMDLSSLFNTSIDELVKGDIDMMKHVVDQNNMYKYSWLMLTFMILAAISVGAALNYSDNWFGLLVPALLWGIAGYFAFKIEKLKKKYNVHTYKEIVNFLEKGPPNQTIARNRWFYLIEKSLIVIGFAVLIVFIAWISIYVLGYFKH